MRLISFLLDSIPAFTCRLVYPPLASTCQYAFLQHALLSSSPVQFHYFASLSIFPAVLLLATWLSAAVSIEPKTPDFATIPCKPPWPPVHSLTANYPSSSSFQTFRILLLWPTNLRPDFPFCLCCGLDLSVAWSINCHIRQLVRLPFPPAKTRKGKKGNKEEKKKVNQRGTKERESRPTIHFQSPESSSYYTADSRGTTKYTKAAFFASLNLLGVLCTISVTRGVHRVQSSLVRRSAHRSTAAAHRTAQHNPTQRQAATYIRRGLASCALVFCFLRASSTESLTQTDSPQHLSELTAQDGVRWVRNEREREKKSPKEWAIWCSRFRNQLRYSVARLAATAARHHLLHAAESR
ncbi:hypothetical protein BD289DRAFT_160655 [Coniella lustricola]|uniref:Uncharacterized protein n=1 Tax=Coniella lustricola TaxID=2025994 RepID=A0A2T2ZUH1_9PEZI|nr:hypothetical protein BD289DRAFT_160655 [Coniella lustricola]